MSVSRNTTLSESTANDVSSTSSNSSESHPFVIWTRAEVEALNWFKLDEHFQNHLNILIAVMNQWIHLQENGWYHSQKTVLEKLYETSENKKREIEIHAGLKKYLETANKLQKPRSGQMERRLLPSSMKFIERRVNVYRHFWHNCAYETFYCYLLTITKLSDEDITQVDAKIYIYALLRFKEQEIFNLQISMDEMKQLLIDIDAVIIVLKSRFQLTDSFYLSEQETLNSLKILAEVMPRYLSLIDLRQAFEKSPLHARYVHVRPAILIQFAQILDYVYKIFQEAAIPKKSLLTTKAELAQDKANHVLAILDAKRKEVAIVMQFHQTLQISFGYDDFIELLTYFVGNKSAKLLPTPAFFQFEKEQAFEVALFDKSDPDKPKAIPCAEIIAWREAYIAKQNEDQLAVMPISRYEVDNWKSDEANKKNQLAKQNENNMLDMQLLRVVSIKNMDAHPRYLLSTLPNEEVLKQEQFNNAYLFVKDPIGLFHVVEEKAHPLKIKNSFQLFRKIINEMRVKKKDELKPLHAILTSDFDKKRLILLDQIITAIPGHSHLEITRVTVPAVLGNALLEKQLGAASAAYNDQLLGEGFCSDVNSNNNELEDFFITCVAERKAIWKLNDTISSPNTNCVSSLRKTLDFLLRQVDYKADMAAIYSPHTFKLYSGPQGSMRNFKLLIEALRIFGLPYDQEIQHANLTMQKSKNSSHVLAFQHYIKYISEVRIKFISDAKKILSYWLDQVKDIYILPRLNRPDITEFNTLLRDALILLGDKDLLQFFYDHVRGAIIFKENEDEFKLKDNLALSR